MNNFWNSIKRPVLFALIVFLIGGFGSLIIQRYVAPFLATKPVFRHLTFLTPNSPLVITRTEQVRVNESVNLRNLVKQANPRVVTVLAGSGVVGQNFQETQRQGGIVLSSDGVIATDKAIFSGAGSYAVVMADGKVLPLTFLANDPKSSVALAKVEDSGLSAVGFGNSQELELGQQVIVLSSSDRASAAQFKSSYVSSIFSDNNLGSVYSSERYTPMFSIDSAVVPGASVFNLNGQLVGLGSAEGVVPSEVIHSALDSYFANQTVDRPTLGIRYAVFGRAGSQLLGLPVEEGALVTGTAKVPAVVPGSPAARAGIIEGDIISKINGENVTFSQPISSFLNRSKPGDTWQVTVVQAGVPKDLTVTLTPLQ